MWFLTEVLPGVVAVLGIGALAYQNYALNKEMKRICKEMSQGTAVAMAKMMQVINVAVQRGREDNQDD